MNEEINYLIDNAEFDKKPLLNYITKLQEENQKLVKVIENLEEYIKSCYIVGHTIQNASLDNILNKLTDLKGGSDDVEN